MKNTSEHINAIVARLGKLLPELDLKSYRHYSRKDDYQEINYEILDKITYENKHKILRELYNHRLDLCKLQGTRCKYENGFNHKYSNHKINIISPKVQEYNNHGNICIYEIRKLDIFENMFKLFIKKDSHIYNYTQSSENACPYCIFNTLIVYMYQMLDTIKNTHPVKYYTRFKDDKLQVRIQKRGNQDLNFYKTNDENAPDYMYRWVDVFSNELDTIKQYSLKEKCENYAPLGYSYEYVEQIRNGTQVVLLLFTYLSKCKWFEVHNEIHSEQLYYKEDNIRFHYTKNPHSRPKGLNLQTFMLLTYIQEKDFHSIAHFTPPKTDYDKNAKNYHLIKYKNKLNFYKSFLYIISSASNIDSYYSVLKNTTKEINLDIFINKLCYVDFFSNIYKHNELMIELNDKKNEKNKKYVIENLQDSKILENNNIPQDIVLNIAKFI